MSRTSPDALAREAARLFSLGRVDSIDSAIHAARLNLNDREAPTPSHNLVRRHIQGMSMQALGAEGYAENVNRVLSIAEECMTALEQAFPEVRTLLVGRAARGHIDGDANLHIRLYTNTPLPDIAQALVDFGYDEPAFETIESRHGRLSRLILTDQDCRLLLTRVPPHLVAESRTDLFHDRPVDTLTLEQLRKRIA